jgi:hypothetical protein
MVAMNGAHTVLLKYKMIKRIRCLRHGKLTKSSVTAPH